MKVRVGISMGVQGCHIGDEIEIEDGASPEQIEERSTPRNQSQGGILAGLQDIQAGRIKSLSCVEGGCERDQLLDANALLESRQKDECQKCHTNSWKYAEKDGEPIDDVCGYCALESQLAKAQKDTDRLDWLASEYTELWLTTGSIEVENGAQLREAIDAAGALRAKPEATEPPQSS